MTKDTWKWPAGMAAETLDYNNEDEDNRDV